MENQKQTPKQRKVEGNQVLKKTIKSKESKESFYVRDQDFDSFSLYDYSTEFNNYLSTKYED